MSALSQLPFIHICFFEKRIHAPQHPRNPMYLQAVHIELHMPHQVEPPQIFQPREIRHGFPIDEKGICGVEDVEGFGTQFLTGACDAEEGADRAMISGQRVVMVKLYMIAVGGMAEEWRDWSIGAEGKAVDELADFEREGEEFRER
ncbi:hypothetical protein PtrEW7m1_003867 [Pyrenophora tritici-repentis]|nr:hypothetical protein PtrEW7m1_003867 [Pyrenophora tritici-repentis]